jgi:hypothetical protein
VNLQKKSVWESYYKINKKATENHRGKEGYGDNPCSPHKSLLLSVA